MRNPRNPKKCTTDEFVVKARNVHGFIYDYSKVTYVRALDKVCIVCTKHGEFQQTPNKHLGGQGCKKCSGNYVRTLADFLREAREVHGDYYDYSLVSKIEDYTSTKINIICPFHRVFSQKPSNHVTQGQGCPACAGNEKYTTEEFVSLAQNVHGMDVYNYSNTVYNGMQNNVQVECTQHGIFWVRAANHIHLKAKCYECARPSEIHTLDDFLTKARSCHGKRYNYDKCVYNGSADKLIIICPIHGDFLQKAYSHVTGSGCEKCGNLSTAMKNRKTLDAFILDSQEVHGTQYDYENVNYVNIVTKIEIICRKHGPFKQTPSNHLKGAGCPTCANQEPTTLHKFLRKSREKHGITYDYSLIEAVQHSEEYVQIICSVHGCFQQQARIHMKGHGCIQCGWDATKDKMMKSQEEFLGCATSVHGKLYDYAKVSYKGDGQKIIITCKKHGNFEQTPHSHLAGSGCPSCKHKTEDILHRFLIECDVSVSAQARFDWCGGVRQFPFDFHLVQFNLIVEVDGLQHFKQVLNWRNPKEQQERDVFKMKKALKNGYTVIRILQEDIFHNRNDWKNNLKQHLKLHENPTISYLCDNNEYDDHKHLMQNEQANHCI